jgi:hypothetical protein
LGSIPVSGSTFAPIESSSVSSAIIMAALLPFVLGSILLAHAPTPNDDMAESSPEQRLAFAVKAAGVYQLHVPVRDKSAVTLNAQPLLRWNNLVVREDDGMLFLWTEGEKGRPIAGAQFFLQGPDWHHEFQSLCPDRFEARLQRGQLADWIWQPARGGVEFVAAERIDASADSAGQRLRQMRSIAERFNAAVDQDEKFESSEQLRLLTSPIYRYAAKEQGILDGTIFAFVQGTNPEVLMLIEAANEDAPANVWRYGFARMSCFYLRVREFDQVVWKADREPVPTRDPGSAYFFRFRAQVDQSAEVEVSQDE